MIDYRPIIKTHVQNILNNIDYFDGSQTFKQPKDDYVTYYVFTESKESFVNGGKYVLNISDDTIFDAELDPLTLVTINFDIRGKNSFLNTRNLFNSFDTISNKELLASQGISFMALGAISNLPQLKNTFNEEGYIFDFTFSYDNSHISIVNASNTVPIDGTTKLT